MPKVINVMMELWAKAHELEKKAMENEDRESYEEVRQQKDRFAELIFPTEPPAPRGQGISAVVGSEPVRKNGIKGSLDDMDKLPGIE